MVYPVVPRVSAFDAKGAGVLETDWARATASCHELRVGMLIPETHDTRSIVLEIPDDLRETFRYRPGQFLTFKLPFRGMVLTRSYSLSSSPDTDTEHRVTVKRVDGGRVSNLLNDELFEGDLLMTVPPSGFFTPTDSDRRVVLFGGGSGITPILSIIKSVLATTERPLDLLYTNRDAHSIIFKGELDRLAARHPDRLTVAHRLDDRDGLLDLDTVKQSALRDPEADFYLCGPGAFMELVEQGLGELGVARERVHIERFVSPTDPDRREGSPGDVAVSDEVESVTAVMGGTAHELSYQNGEKLIDAVRRAGLDAPASCEEGYCATCMAKLVSGEVKMDVNDTLTPALLKEGWVLTCQARCIRGRVRVEYPA